MKYYLISFEMIIFVLGVFLLGLCSCAAESAWDTRQQLETGNPSRKCDLQRLYVSNFPEKYSLVEHLHSLDTPVIIEGALSNWSALEKWKDKTYFVEKFGDLLLPPHVVSKNSLDVAHVGSSTDEIASEGYTLGDFLLSLDDDFSPGELGSKPFLFQMADNVTSSLIAELVNDLEPYRDNVDESNVRYIPHHLSGVFGTDSVDLPVLSVGSGTSGFPPHKNAASWHGLVIGNIKWTLFPPARLSPASFVRSGKENRIDMYVQAAMNTPSSWSNELRETLGGSFDGEINSSDQGMLQCIQLPSEVIYVPSAWWQARENIGDAISIGSTNANMSLRPLYKKVTSDGNNHQKRTFTRELRDCAMSLLSLCHSLPEFLPTSEEGARIRHLIQDITSAVEDENLRKKGGSGLIESNGSGIGTCNAVAHRQIIQEALDLEPLNIKIIEAYAKSLSLYPLEHIGKRSSILMYDPIVSSTGNPVLRAAKFLYGKAKMVYKQFKMSRIRPIDAKQLVERMGLLMDELPEFAGQALACPNTPHVKTCGTWGMNDVSNTKFQSILDGMVKLYKKIDVASAKDSSNQVNSEL